MGLGVEEQVRPYAAGLYGLLPRAVQQALSSVDDAVSKGFDGALTGVGQVLRWLGWPAWPIAAYSAWFVLAVAAATFVAGSIAFLLAPSRASPPLPDEPFSGKPSPDP